MSVIAFGRDGGKKNAQIWGEANTYIFSYIADCRRIRRISELARDHRLLFYIFSSTPSTQTTFSTANPTPKSLHESVNHFFFKGKRKRDAAHSHFYFNHTNSIPSFSTSPHRCCCCCCAPCPRSRFCCSCCTRCWMRYWAALTQAGLPEMVTTRLRVPGA